MKRIDLLVCLCLLVLSASSTTYQSSEMSAYTFDGPSRAEFSRLYQYSFEMAGVPDVTVGTNNIGESCVYADGMRFSPPYDLYVMVDNVDLENKALLDDYTFRILSVLKPSGRLKIDPITLAFNASAPQIVVKAPYKTMMTILDQHPTGEGLLDALRAN